MRIHAQSMWNKVGSGSYRGVDLVESLNHKNYHNFYRKSYPFLPRTNQKRETIQGKTDHTIQERETNEVGNYRKEGNDRTIQKWKTIEIAGKRSKLMVICTV